jgi:Domain of unknown function (DUF4190)
MSAEDTYPPGPPGTKASPSDRYFVGLTYSRAKNAFWLGVFSFFCFGPFLGIPALYVGVRALKDIAASGGRLKGRRTAWEGIVLGVLGSVGGLGVYYWHFLG